MYQIMVTPKPSVCYIYRNNKVVSSGKGRDKSEAVKEAVKQVRMVRRGKNW